MVSALLVDTLHDASAQLQALYTKEYEADDFPSLVASHFSNVFSSAAAFENIPKLSIAHPPPSFAPRALVSFRCMIQDTSPSNEIYLSRYSNGKCGGWGLVEELTDDSKALEAYNYDDLRECTVLWAVTIPGENTWLQSGGGSSNYVSPLPYKYPIPGAPHVGVKIKIYNQTPEFFSKSTDTQIFVGILSSEPVSPEADPEVQVPTLHVLFSRIDQPSVTISNMTAEESESTRDEIISWMAQEALGGDIDSAEWILLASISKVHSRNPPILPSAVTISRFSPAHVKPRCSTTDAMNGSPNNVENTSLPETPTISLVLSLLFRRTLLVPLSLQFLNTTPFSPSSPAEDLHSGYLQLPLGSLLIIDEGGVQEGVVNEKGLTNIRTLQEVITGQSLPYVFPFSSFQFPTEFGHVILAEGRKSAFFTTDIVVPLSPTMTQINLRKPLSEVQLPSAEKMSAWREYLAFVKSDFAKTKVNEETAIHIQEAFVEQRRCDPAGTKPEDLMLQMNIARVLAISLREPEVTVAVWTRARALEMRRKARR